LGLGCGGYVVVGCGGYVVFVAEAMWFWLRRLCVGELKNKTNLSLARASLLGLSLAITKSLNTFCTRVVVKEDINKASAYLNIERLHRKKPTSHLFLMILHSCCICRQDAEKIYIHSQTHNSILSDFCLYLEVLHSL
jgi:hypothetical protein